MEEAYRNELQSIVEEEIVRLDAQIAELEAKTSPISPECSLGRLTRLEAMGEKEVNERLLQQSLLRRVRLKNTLERIGNEEFGLCIDCGEPIALERLRLRPESLRCIDCEHLREEARDR